MATKKPVCKYGAKCYRRNPQHRKDFIHPDADISDDSTDESEPAPKRTRSEPEPEPEPEPEQQKQTKKSPPSQTGKPRTITDFFQRTGQKSSPKKDSKESEPAAKPKGHSNYVRKKEEPAAEASDAPEEDCPPSPEDERENIRTKFLVGMPEDFYHFWDLAKSLKPGNPRDAFWSKLGLQLVGPYDVLAGRTCKKNSRGRRPCYLRHWRYYYDPPEFLTVLRGDDASQFHMGYFRDDPAQMPVFVASNAAKEDGTITPRGENIFAAVNWYIEDLIKKGKHQKADLATLKAKVVSCAEHHGLSMEPKTAAMKARDKKINCRTFHKAGMVVPVDDNDVGYREVPETTGDLKKMLKQIVSSKDDEQRNRAFDPFMELMTLVQFANDECDYGEGLELGLDVFTYGGAVFKRTILNLLPLAYDLLGRPQFKTIIEAHMEDRRHSADLSQVD